MKRWKLSYCDDLYKNIEEGTPARRILDKEFVLDEPNWELDLTEEEAFILEVKRYPPNP